jgi:uncharacterized cupin superfamily protein
VVPEAPLERTDTGLVPAGEGWFVVNVRDARWFDVEGPGFGPATVFEDERARFAQVGLNLNILRPGQPMSLYHGEGAQEGFLVLSGECLLIVEGLERSLRRWDFVHCPPWTEHVFVGAGDGPCLVLAVGAREGRDDELLYPVNDVALAHGAGVEQETAKPAEAYAGFPEARPVPCPDEFPS